MKDPQSVDSNSVLICGTNIYGLEYMADSFRITEGQIGQPPPTFAQTASGWNITIMANRQNSSPIADSFMNMTGGVDHVYSTYSVEDKSPAELNFYFGVYLNIEVNATFYSIPLYLGQGHTGLDNNWWIGGNAVCVGNSEVAELAIGNGQARLVMAGMNAFEIEFV
jgi:hypothetical protein